MPNPSAVAPELTARDQERIGIIVVHGVGDAREGWTDTDLVPNLQRWMAYRRVDIAPADETDRDMVLVAPTNDQRHLAIALDCDDNFKAFCRVVGRDDLLSVAEFKDAGARKKHRDKLIGTVSAITHSVTSDALLADLTAAKVPAAVAFEPQSRVHRVRDPESSDPARTWQAYTRSWSIANKQVLFTELFWADMSKVGTTVYSRLFSILELILEAPVFLGRALMKDSTSGVHSLIRMLVATASWLMRWPVAGLNAAIFLTALLAIVVKQSGPSPWLPHGIAGALVILAIAGLLVCRKQVHSRPGLADLGLSASLSALMLLALLGWLAFGKGMTLPPTPEPYLVYSILILLIAWTAWTIPIILAIVLVLLVGLKRLVVRRKPSSPPLARPAAAISLNLVLAIIVKFFFSAFGILVVTTLVAPNNQSAADACGDQARRSNTAWWADTEFFEKATAPCQLAELKRLLLEISAFNAFAIGLLILTAALLAGYRMAKRGILRKAAKEGRLTLPRLIASPLIIAMLFAGALFNAAFVYIPGAAANLWLPSAILGFLRDSGLEHLGAGALIAFIFIIARVVETSDAVLHIGRDLVDHQYDRSPRSLAMLVAGGMSSLEKPTGPRKRYRRRARIQRRLEALIDEVIARQNVDRLIFVAHSQGTVIMRDYLLDHDQLIADRRHQAARIADVQRIDVVTLGSPLTHLYKYYFSDDGQVENDGRQGAKQIEKVRSWTNIWRVDDPIGQCVDPLPKLPVANRGIRPGGHTGYWQEAEVCETIWRLIMSPPTKERAEAAARNQPLGAPPL